MRVCRGLRFMQEEGSSIIELAIAVPVLMTILTGAASFSMALFSVQQLGSATSTTAQLLGAERGLIPDPCALAVTTVKAALPSWTASKLTYTVTITDSSGTAHKYGPTLNALTCPAGAAYMASNQPVTVAVSYQYTWMPILSFSPSSSLGATQTALME